jgi:hypothetical protein
MSTRWISLAALAAGGLASAGCAPERRALPLEVYRDKLEGAWIGQMVGVAYGAPYEFRSPGAIDEGDIRTWRPEYVDNALQQDDLYVELTWLACLEDHGLDATAEQAAAAFAATEFPLWHANAAGRENIRRGVGPPASGAPPHNPHYRDIDFQIEADALGILCPGLPDEALRLGHVFGQLMNAEDGLYGGLFVQGMYSAAYFEGEPLRVVEAGLACIPAESRYARCIRDVIAGWRERPADWRATWRKIETLYNAGDDCTPGPLSIDAALNGAYVALALLYGGDNFWQVCEIATRCGQDSDCNPSSAAGVWGCMHGRSGLPAEAIAGVERIEGEKFLHTRYSLRELLLVCRILTEDVVRRAGGEVTETELRIPRPG